MIYYLSTQVHQYTVRDFLRTWGRDLAPRLRPVAYEDLLGPSLSGVVRRHTQERLRAFVFGRLARARRAQVATLLRRSRHTRSSTVPLPRSILSHVDEHPVYVFSDLERLGAEYRERAAALWDSLREALPAARLLNHPLAACRRFALLRLLHERGVNDFDVYRADEARVPDRFPVFLRGEEDHAGSETGLLHTQAELDDALASSLRAGRAPERRLVVEFCAERDERQLFRKYSAWNVGGRIVAGHLFFGRGWCLKEPETTDDEALATELEYVRTNPHAEELASIFSSARIDYGRADYGFVGGRIQVYEINTNPGVSSLRPPLSAPGRAAALEHFARQFRAGLVGLETG